MFNLDLEKEEEAEIKLPTSVGSLEKTFMLGGMGAGEEGDDRG